MSSIIGQKETVAQTDQLKKVPNWSVEAALPDLSKYQTDQFEAQTDVTSSETDQFEKELDKILENWTDISLARKHQFGGELSVWLRGNRNHQFGPTLIFGFSLTLPNWSVGRIVSYSSLQK